MPGLTEDMVFIFFTGCLFMALLYHFVLSLIQRSKLILYYSAYLFVATLFLTERVFENELAGSYLFHLIDEPVQMLLFFTYTRFVAHAINLFTIPVKRYILYYRIVLWGLALYIIFHIAGITLGFLSERVLGLFIGIRVLLIVFFAWYLTSLAKYINNYFFKYAIIGSFVMLFSWMLAFITTINEAPFLGIFGVMWSCIGIVLDVVCFSAALGYKARKDAELREKANLRIVAQEKQIKQKEIEAINAYYKARDEERNRIAGDLHDDIGASLSSMHIFSQLAEKTLGKDKEKTKSILEKLSKNSRNILENMGDIVWAMQKQPGDAKSFLARIKNYGQELLAHKGIACTYPKLEDIGDCMHHVKARKNLLLIVKEAMNNIAKYSNASHAEIRFQNSDGWLHLHVKDNGVGFVQGDVPAGNGLKNMKFRTLQLGGQFECNSNCQKGAEIHCSFPIANIREEFSKL